MWYTTSTMAMVYLALGSNVGDGNQQFDMAISLLKTQFSDIIEAPRYRSKAVGVTDQPDFLNTVIRAKTELSPQSLLEFTKATEQEVGRVHRYRWGPREIDIDIIFYDDVVTETPTLTLPHPRFSERDFVLKPVLDINPTFVDPLSGQTIQELFNALGKNEHSIKN